MDEKAGSTKESIESKFMSIEEAVRKYIHDDDFIVVGGVTSNRNPMALVHEIVRQGKKGLTVVLSPTGPAVDLLLDAGCVSRIDTSWLGHETSSGAAPSNSMRNAVEKGRIAVHDQTLFMINRRVEASAKGLPFMPTRTAMGSDIYNPKMDGFKPFRGKDPKIPKERYRIVDDPFFGSGKVILLPAATVDVVIVHAQYVGEEGTVRVVGPEMDREALYAAKRVIVTCEKIVSEEKLRQEPKLNTLDGGFVTAVCEAPWGAHPTAVQGFYMPDYQLIEGYIKFSKDENNAKNWLKEWVYGVKNHEEYLAKVGIGRLLELQRAMKPMYRAF